MLIRHLAIALSLCVAAISGADAVAQTPMNNLPRRSVNGVEYLVYEVQPKDNLYTISAKLGVDRAEIVRLNPAAGDGIKEGDELLFPVQGDSPARTHLVQPKETIYSIARRYNLKTADILEWNPTAEDGIVVGQVLYISKPTSVGEQTASVVVEPEPVTAMPQRPAQSGPAKAVARPVNQPELRTHTIAQGESLYRISIDHGTTVDEILAVNPELDRDHYKAGQVIYLPESKTVEHTAVESVPETRNAVGEGVTHTVQDGETFYSIAHKYNLTVEELEKANPEVGIIRPGMVLNIPAADTTLAANALPDSIPAEVEADPTDTQDNDITTVVENTASIDIALTLPLMLSAAEQPRQAQLFTEFYKGFLVAVDSMRRCGAPIHLQVYDTSASQDTLAAILTNPELAKAKVIVAPDNEAQLDMLGAYGRQNNIDILNLFVVKDDGYRTNAAMMQGNIPHHEMYLKSVNGIIDRLGNFTPVILKRDEAPDDKAEYIATLISALDRRGVAYRQITFDGSLKDTDLDSLDSSRPYVFIPASGRQAELNRILPALIEFKLRSTLPDPLRVYGYPEWTTFRGETLVNMHKVNTFVYSRFYTVPDDPAVKNIENAFMRWYGTPMANFVPRQGLFGFDTAMFLIQALKQNVGPDGKISYPRWSGVQNGFDFINCPTGGLVNNELYLINYRPSGLIDKILL